MAAAPFFFLNLVLAPILIHSFQLAPPPTRARARGFIATAIHEHRAIENDATVTTAASSTAPYEWIQKDLEAQLRDAKLSGFTKANGQKQEAIKIIFSDIDGSLIHYPKHFDETQQQLDDDNKILALPPSATGMRGIISSKTLATCRDLRIKKGVKLVLVTGARTSTLLNRLPYLPKADAYCTEAGGRIFYPTDIDCCNEEIAQSQFTYTPVEYSGAAADSEDLKPFGLQEDLTWRKRMEMGGAGTESFAGNEVLSNRCDESDEVECMIDYDSVEGFPFVEDEVPITQRQGHLWEFANRLVEEDGFVLDTKSYSTCFRVNKKHQQNDKFDALLAGEIAYPEATIGKSTNLGCIDFFPAVSGKQNCCQYLANELGFSLATNSVCICDDDNDVEMALACSHSYIPTLTSESMVDTLRKNKSDFTLTFGADIHSTAATEAALNSIYKTT